MTDAQSFWKKHVIGWREGGLFTTRPSVFVGRTRGPRRLPSIAIRLSYWFGLTQPVGEPTPADGWSWNGDGLALSFTNWQPGQPDDGTGTENDAEQGAYIADDDTW